METLKLQMTVFIEDSFDAAHWLPNVPEDHKCHRMHGHTYRVRLEVTGRLDGRLGWVIDYADLKREWDAVKGWLDHHDLNEILPNPTCELLAEYIGGYLPIVTRIAPGNRQLRRGLDAGMKGKRVRSKKTGETGVVTKVIGRCLWVRMDAGHELSGARQYFSVIKDA